MSPKRANPKAQLRETLNSTPCQLLAGMTFPGAPRFVFACSSRIAASCRCMLHVVEQSCGNLHGLARNPLPAPKEPLTEVITAKTKHCPLVKIGSFSPNIVHKVLLLPGQSSSELVRTATVQENFPKLSSLSLYLRATVLKGCCRGLWTLHCWDC